MFIYYFDSLLFLLIIYLCFNTWGRNIFGTIISGLCSSGLIYNFLYISLVRQKMEKILFCKEFQINILVLLIITIIYIDVLRIIKQCKIHELIILSSNTFFSPIIESFVWQLFIFNIDKNKSIKNFHLNYIFYSLLFSFFHFDFLFLHFTMRVLSNYVFYITRFYNQSAEKFGLIMIEHSIYNFIIGLISLCLQN